MKEVFRAFFHVTWDGGNLRFAQPAYTQGRVIAISSAAAGNYCDWKARARRGKREGSTSGANVRNA